jgi:hypothetical protein
VKLAEAQNPALAGARPRFSFLFLKEQIKGIIIIRVNRAPVGGDTAER